MKTFLSINSVLLTVLLLIASCTPKNKMPNTAAEKGNGNVSCLAFYNLENLYDTIDNKNVDDEDFTPNGSMKWGSLKYNAKIQHMSHAISQIGLDNCSIGATIVGLAEIENKGVLTDLIKQPELIKRGYQIVHYDSPDRRGIDVGLLYNPKYFNVSNSKSYRLNMDDPNFLTRDQLMVSGILQGEKVHIIVNHWPSRSGGELASRTKRNAAAALTRSIVDSLFIVDAKAKIIIMGDLNDDPMNESCAKILKAKKDSIDLNDRELFNTLWNTLDTGVGSLSYNNQWNLFDQFIISSELIKANNSKLKFWKAEVFNKPFLTQQEGKYKGTPLRTHSGKMWTNGYSDHYPTLIYLNKVLK